MEPQLELELELDLELDLELELDLTQGGLRARLAAIPGVHAFVRRRCPLSLRLRGLLAALPTHGGG